MCFILKSFKCFSYSSLGMRNLFAHEALVFVRRATEKPDSGFSYLLCVDEFYLALWASRARQLAIQTLTSA